MKLAHIKVMIEKIMHQASIKRDFDLKAKSVLPFDIAYSDIHTTKYSQSHENDLKKNARGGIINLHFT